MYYCSCVVSHLRGFHMIVLNGLSHVVGSWWHQRALKSKLLLMPRLIPPCSLYDGQQSWAISTLAHHMASQTTSLGFPGPLHAQNTAWCFCHFEERTREACSINHKGVFKIDWNTNIALRSSSLKLWDAELKPGALSSLQLLPLTLNKRWSVLFLRWGVTFMVLIKKILYGCPTHTQLTPGGLQHSKYTTQNPHNSHGSDSNTIKSITWSAPPPFEGPLGLPTKPHLLGLSKKQQAGGNNVPQRRGHHWKVPFLWSHQK